jgi:hypothetical protein
MGAPRLRFVQWISLIATSAAVAAVVSGLVQWLTGLHRERETARRDLLFNAVADFLAAETTRWNYDSKLARAQERLAEAIARGEEKVEPEILELITDAKASYPPALFDALNALNRIRLISQTVYDAAEKLVDMDRLPSKDDGHSQQMAARYRTMDELVITARKEIRLARFQPDLRLADRKRSPR